MLSEISQSQRKQILYDSTQVVRFTETESRMVIIRGWGEGEMGSCCLMGTQFQLCKAEKFWRLVAQQCGYTLHH